MTQFIQERKENCTIYQRFIEKERKNYRKNAKKNRFHRLQKIFEAKSCK